MNAGGASNVYVTAELLDSGNFVLKDSATNSVIWQSFDTPTDTLLPDQTLFANKSTSLLVSWATAENWTSSGSSYQLDWVYLNGTGMPPSLALSWTGASIANWNRSSWSTTNASDSLNAAIVYPYWFDSTHADHAYLSASGSFLLGNAVSGSVVVAVNSTSDQGPSALRRMTLDRDGGFRVYSFTVGGASTSWSLEANLVPDQCQVFAECGPYGICSPDPQDPSFLAKCTCPITGIFEPIDATDQYKGCQYSSIDQIDPAATADLCNNNNTIPATADLSSSSSSKNNITLVQAGYFDYPYADRLDNYLSLNETACIQACTQDCRCAGAVVWRSEERCYLKAAPLFNGGFTVQTTDRISYLKIIVTAANGSASGTDPAAALLDHRKLAAIVAGVGASAALVLIIVFGFSGLIRFRRWRLHGSSTTSCKRRARGGTKPTFNHLGMGPRKFTYKELSNATRNFSDVEMVGSGGMGTVYKGVLQQPGVDGSSTTTVVVAVKRLRYDAEALQTGSSEQGFVTEASSISQIRHRNLVQLQGWCYEDTHLLLVYDFMVNGSLDHWLYERNRRPAARSTSCNDQRSKYARGLSWELRYSILSGVAAALAYLHEEWQQCVLHRDIKPSNVMLDAEFNAHLGDFGLARLVDHQKVEKTTMMAGTLGYMAPEIPYTGKATKETDVYSFGVLVLEVVCGRHPVDTMSLETEPEDVLLVNRVRRAHDAGKLLSVVDPRIAPLSTVSHFHTTSTMSAHAESKDDHLDFCEALSRRIQQEMCIESEQKSLVLRLGLLCSLPQPSARPSMRIVKQVLSSGDATLLPPLPPSFPFTGSADELYPHFLLSDQAPLMTEQSLSPHSSSSST